MTTRNVGRGRGINPWNKGVGGGGGQSNIPYESQKSAEDKFREAQEKLQASVQKHLDDHEYDSSSDEGDLESESILNSVFKNYNKLDGKREGIERTQQFLENSFQSGAGICLICIASIKRVDPIWNCLECYGYFHLICIQKWSRDSIYQQKSTQQEMYAIQPIDKVLWPCPKCRHEYEEVDVPKKYLCFCGKVEDPQHHPWLVPHSCGDTCNKALKPECGHNCLLLCHPGPCPPCPKTVESYCYCRKQGPKHQRCSNKLWSCNSKCEKPLACKKHLCEESCHSGECPPCNKESYQKCKCGQRERKRPCFDPIWQCDKVCDKPFPCGFHKCSLVCHEGDCGDCPLSLERTCPCGKTSFVLPCTEDVSTCNDTCDKLLDCGSHRCPQKCHKDKCGMCLEVVTKVCRCGQHKKDLPCQKDFLCETKCKRVKNCTRHPCNRKCCDLRCPPCEKPCGRTLKCGYHKCPSVCHMGQCYPCPQVAQVKCRCGQTVITVPCGRQKKTSPPKCNKLCMIPPDCHHPAREPHNCHYRECPPCRQMCGKERENCSHRCSAPCHTSVVTKLQGDHPPAGPWEVESKTIRCSFPCPECKVPVPVTCFGGHETVEQPCHLAKPSSCQRFCGRLLKCGNHLCDKECHVVTGAGDASEAGENCSECESECLKERLPGCTHPCPNPCHPDPCPPCNLNVKVKCHCGISVLYIHCGELNSENDDDDKVKLLSCGNQCPKNYPCGHKCKANCHPGDCPNPDSCRKKVKLPCKCGRFKKEFTCDVVRKSNMTTIECDDVCARKKEEAIKAKELELERKREEEERKNREELERFEKKFHARRKQKETKVEPKQETTFFFRYYLVIFGAVFGLTAAIIYFLM